MSLDEKVGTPQEEFARLLTSCQNLRFEQLEGLEEMVDVGLSRLGRALMSDTLQQQADTETPPSKGAFPP